MTGSYITTRETEFGAIEISHHSLGVLGYIRKYEDARTRPVPGTNLVRHTGTVTRWSADVSRASAKRLGLSDRQAAATVKTQTAAKRFLMQAHGLI